MPGPTVFPSRSLIGAGSFPPIPVDMQVDVEPRSSTDIADKGCGGTHDAPARPDLDRADSAGRSRRSVPLPPPPPMPGAFPRFVPTLSSAAPGVSRFCRGSGLSPVPGAFPRSVPTLPRPVPSVSRSCRGLGLSRAPSAFPRFVPTLSRQGAQCYAGPLGLGLPPSPASSRVPPESRPQRRRTCGIRPFAEAPPAAWLRVPTPRRSPSSPAPARTCPRAPRRHRPMPLPTPSPPPQPSGARSATRLSPKATAPRTKSCETLAAPA